VSKLSGNVHFKVNQSPALRFHQKYLHLCSEDERKSYRLEQHEGE